MKNFFTLVLFLFCGILQSQTIILGSQLSGANPIRTTNGCTTPCLAYCSPTGTGNHAATPCSGILSIPAMQYLSITITSNMCDVNSGLDGGDLITINGVGNDPNAPYSANEVVNWTSCFFNPFGEARDIPIVFTVNRRDETITVTGTISATDPGGCTSLAPLPVKFSLFDVESNGKSNNLSFTTLSEVNNDYFTIERSADGLTFDDIARIAGAGNSGEELNYQYADNSPMSGINYYRIRQTDYDGTFAYSEIVSATIGSRDVFTLTPRVTNDVLEIKSSDDNNTASVYTLTGNLVKTISFVGQTSTISIADLAAGMYIVRLSNTVDNQSFKIRKL